VTISTAVIGLPGAGEAAQRLSSIDLVARLNHFYEIATRAVVARDGTVDKLMSDQVIAFFGTPFNEREHTLRAVEAAAEVIVEMEDKWSGTSAVAAAVGTGKAFVGNVGQGGTRDYTAIGQMVNATHELFANARTGEVLLLPAAYEAVSFRYPDASVHTITLADHDAPVAARAVSVRARGAARVPRRTLATILVLDLVASTEIASRIGDTAWRDLLARHYARIRELLAAHNGTEIDTAGDGLLATFATPIEAVRFAQAAIDADGALDLRTRVGLHAGEVEHDQGAIRGIAVVTAARIGALAGAGEIFVSSTVRDLVAGSGVGFENHGVRTLKGVAEPRQIYGVMRSPD
jgi:class 3 adenylate cyclase